MSEPGTASFVVRRVDPRQRRIVIGAIAVAALFVGVGAFWAGYRSADVGAPDRERHREVLTDLQKAYAENERLRDRIAALERSEQVARNANRKLREEIAGLQEELARVRSDLSLYQGLASAAGSASDSPTIHQLLIQPTSAPRVYRFSLTLMQNLERAELVNGRVSISVEGTRNGEPVLLGLRDLQASSQDDLAFSFKYFRLLDGTLTLPADFTPGRVLVEVRAENDGNETLKADFDWSAVVKQSSRQTSDTGASGS